MSRSATNRRSSVPVQRQAKLVAVSATGPIYRVPARFTAVSVESSLTLHRELAAKAVDPKAKVISSLAGRVDGANAISAWLLQTTGVAASLSRLEARGRLQFLGQVLSYIRRNGAAGNETVLAAAINATWPWLSMQALESTLRFTMRSLDRSDYTDRVQCTVVDPSSRTVTLLDPGQLKSANPNDWLDLQRAGGEPIWRFDDEYWRLGPVKDRSGTNPSEADLGRFGGNEGSYTADDIRGPGGYQGPGRGSGGYGWQDGPLGWGGEGGYTADDIRGPGGYQGPGRGSGGYGWQNDFSRGGFGGMGMQSPGMAGGPLGFGSFPGLGGASDWWGDQAQQLGKQLSALGTGIMGYAAITNEPRSKGAIFLGGVVLTVLGAGLDSAGANRNANERAAAQTTPAATPAPPPAPGPKPAPTITIPVVVIPVDDDDDNDEKDKEKPHTGDQYSDSDGGGAVDPTKIWDGDGGIGPTTIWEGDGGVGPATIWDENGGGGNPTTMGTEITALTLAGPGLRAGVVQVSQSTFVF